MEKQFSVKLVPSHKDWGLLSTPKQELCQEHPRDLCNILVQAYLEIVEWVNESVFPLKIWAFHAVKLRWRYWIYWVISSFKPSMWHNSKINPFLWIILVLKQLESPRRDPILFSFTIHPCLSPPPTPHLPRTGHNSQTSTKKMTPVICFWIYTLKCT